MLREPFVLCVPDGRQTVFRQLSEYHISDFQSRSIGDEKNGCTARGRRFENTRVAVACQKLDILIDRLPPGGSRDGDESGGEPGEKETVCTGGGVVRGACLHSMSCLTPQAGAFPTDSHWRAGGLSGQSATPVRNYSKSIVGFKRFSAHSWSNGARPRAPGSARLVARSMKPSESTSA